MSKYKITKTLQKWQNIKYDCIILQKWQNINIYV